MDAKLLGSFIAERRKELGLTQVVLAEKLHVLLNVCQKAAVFPDAPVFVYRND